MGSDRSQIGTSEAGSQVAVIAINPPYFILKEYISLLLCVKQLCTHWVSYLIMENNFLLTTNVTPLTEYIHFKHFYTQQAHYINTTSPQRRCNDASTLSRRCINVMCLLGHLMSNKSTDIHVYEGVHSTSSSWEGHAVTSLLYFKWKRFSLAVGNFRFPRNCSMYADCMMVDIKSSLKYWPDEYIKF